MGDPTMSFRFNIAIRSEDHERAMARIDDLDDQLTWYRKRYCDQCDEIQRLRVAAAETEEEEDLPL